MNEFEIIKQYFSDPMHTRRNDVLTGIGDDAARVSCEHTIVTRNLTLQAEKDFQPDDAADSIGHSLLARTLAQLIARGAEPAWALLSLSMPQADAPWLKAFSLGLMQLTTQAGVQLVGGDTTRSPAIRLSLNCHGILQQGIAKQPYRPVSGDLIYVIGNLGEAGLAILDLRGEIHLPIKEKQAALARLHYPDPPLGLEQLHQLVPVHAFTLADGLSASLGKAVEHFRIGASLYPAQLPCPEQLVPYLDMAGDYTLLLESPQPCTLAMIIAAEQQALFEQSVQDLGYRANWVGSIESQPGVRVID